MTFSSQVLILYHVPFPEVQVTERTNDCCLKKAIHWQVLSNSEAKGQKFVL